jgi:hypothetical protein
MLIESAIYPTFFCSPLPLGNIQSSSFELGTTDAAATTTVLSYCIMALNMLVLLLIVVLSKHVLAVLLL